MPWENYTPEVTVDRRPGSGCSPELQAGELTGGAPLIDVVEIGHRAVGVAESGTALSTGGLLPFIVVVAGGAGGISPEAAPTSVE